MYFNLMKTKIPKKFFFTFLFFLTVPISLLQFIELQILREVPKVFNGF